MSYRSAALNMAHAWCRPVGSYHLCSHDRSGQLGRRCTVAACTSAVTSVTHERALETREPSCVPRVVKPFFYSCGPQPIEGHGTRGNTRAPLSERQSPEPWDTWQHRSSSRQRGKVRSQWTCGSVRAHLNKEARSGSAGHVVAPEPTSVGRCGPKL
jgi:hypothetical protein